mmetsp:Transcript_80126/g.228316  ORF Transcript_80126/g.228316 Transcript_80126/m.228316 type:complete len:309 (+) Transcript_80126:325-1251(+)
MRPASRYTLTVCSCSWILIASRCTRTSSSSGCMTSASALRQPRLASSSDSSSRVRPSCTGITAPKRPAGLRRVTACGGPPASTTSEAKLVMAVTQSTSSARMGSIAVLCSTPLSSGQSGPSMYMRSTSRFSRGTAKLSTSNMFSTSSAGSSSSTRMAAHDMVATDLCGGWKRLVGVRRITAASRTTACEREGGCLAVPMATSRSNCATLRRRWMHSAAICECRFIGPSAIFLISFSLTPRYGSAGSPIRLLMSPISSTGYGLGTRASRAILAARRNAARVRAERPMSTSTMADCPAERTFWMAGMSTP